jgi:hypothetical protein
MIRSGLCPAGAQDRAQLLLKDALDVQRDADRAPAEERILLALAANVGRVLVGTDVERADRDRALSHALHHGAVEHDLFVLARKVAVREKRKLGAEQADAFGAVHVGKVEIREQPDVREQ